MSDNEAAIEALTERFADMLDEWEHKKALIGIRERAGRLARVAYEAARDVEREPACERWWITDEKLDRGGRKLLGPFESKDLTLRVREHMENANPRGATFWIEAEARAALNASPQAEPSA